MATFSAVLGPVLYPELLREAAAYESWTLVATPSEVSIDNTTIPCNHHLRLYTSWYFRGQPRGETVKLLATYRIAVVQRNGNFELVSAYTQRKSCKDLQARYFLRLHSWGPSLSIMLNSQPAPF